MLAHFNPDLETWVEFDASDYVMATILSQKHHDGILRLAAFMFKKISPTEYNYEIYDKKFLIIIRAFEKWRLELAKISMEDPIYVVIDYKNLEYFMSTKDLNRRQTQ